MGNLRPVVEAGQRNRFLCTRRKRRRSWNACWVRRWTKPFPLVRRAPSITNAL